MAFDFHFECSQAYLSAERFIRLTGKCYLGLGRFEDRYLDFAKGISTELSELEVSSDAQLEDPGVAPVGHSSLFYSEENNSVRASAVIPESHYQSAEDLVRLFLGSARDLVIYANLAPASDWRGKMKLIKRPVAAGDTQLATDDEFFFQSMRAGNSVPIDEFSIGLGTPEDQRLQAVTS